MSGHNKVEIDLSKPYQRNEIGVRGIVYFGVGLFLLIVVTFVLMYIFQYGVLEEQRLAEDERDKSPMAMTEEERLPPEPRLQGAPGFGVESKDGRVNLELRNPQAEYHELQEQWKELWENGEKDPKTGTVVATSMEAAIEKVLNDGSIKSVTGESGEKALQEATTVVSSSSAGRMSSEKIR